MADKTRTVLTKLQKELRWWFAREEKEGALSQRVHRDLGDRLAGREWKDLVLAGSAAQDWSVFQVGFGSVCVLDGDLRGWGHISNAVRYYYLFQRILHAHNRKNGRPYAGFMYSVHWFMHMFCLAVALGREAEAKWLGQELAALFEHGIVQARSHDEQYQQFVRALIDGYLNRRWPEFSGDDDSPYREMFRSTDDMVLAGAIELACERHLDTAVEGDDESGSDRAFAEVGFTLLPVEILAYEALREMLCQPRVNRAQHPLLNSRLAEVPTEIPELQDPMLESLDRRVMEVLR